MRRLSVLLFTLLALVGCRPDETGPGLITLVELTPNRVEVGDRVEIAGVGFPEGRSATLTFRGDLYRPGRDPLRRVEVVVKATATSSSRLGFTLGDATEEELCGRGEDADHTTFRGDVVAAFAPRSPGAPPVAGVLRDVVLDFAGPSVSPTAVASREAEGRKTAEVLGLSFEPDTLTVSAIEPRSRAERAALQVGDALYDVDGVRVASIADLRVSGKSPVASVWVRRPNVREPREHFIDVQGVRPSAPRDLLGAFAIVGAFVLLLGALFFPGARLVGFVERGLAERLRQRRASRARRAEPTWRPASVSLPGSEPIAVRLLPALVFLAVSAAGAGLAFGRPLVAAELDLALALLVYVTVSLVGGLVVSGWSECGRWALGRGLLGALCALWARLPLLGGVAAAVQASGSVRFSDHVRAQDALPWGFAAFSSPVLFLALLLVLVVSVPRVEPRLATFDAAAGEHAPTEAGRGMRTAAVVDAVHLIIVGQLVAILLLGGWRLPWAATTGWTIAGAVLLQLKAWLVVAVILGLRAGLPRVSTRQIPGVWGRSVLPLTVGLVVLGAVHGVGARLLFADSPEPLFGMVLFAATLGLGAWFLVRVSRQARGPSPAHVSPWL